MAIGVPTQPAVVQLEGAALRVHLRRVADLDELGELCLSVEVDWRAGAEDVVAQVLDAVPGIAEREWKPVPSVDGTKSPLWIALVDQEWVERLQAAAEQHGVAALADDPTLAADDAAGVAHVVYRSEVTAATVERRMILTACGKRIVPRNDWRGLAECEQCVRTRDAIQRGMAVVWALGEDPD